MDIKTEVEKIVKKIQGDKVLQSQFKKDPMKAVQGIVGNNIPTDQLGKVVEEVSKKVALDKVAGGKLGFLSKIFKKK